MGQPVTGPKAALPPKRFPKGTGQSSEEERFCRSVVTRTRAPTRGVGPTGQGWPRESSRETRTAGACGCTCDNEQVCRVDCHMDDKQVCRAGGAQGEASGCSVCGSGRRCDAALPSAWRAGPWGPVVLVARRQLPARVHCKSVRSPLHAGGGCTGGRRDRGMGPGMKEPERATNGQLRIFRTVRAIPSKPELSRVTPRCRRPVSLTRTFAAGTGQ